ncbi:MAG: hypothetical protein ACJ748_17015 [Flavisolibacter sp.]|jgi:hypothetical protein
MGLLTPKDNKGGKKGSGGKNSKNANQGSKFITNKNSKGQGNFTKKGMTGGSQRGS